MTRRPALDALRTLAILLVVLEHSLLPYQEFYPLNPADILGNIHPVIDTAWAPATAFITIVGRLHVTILFLISGYLLPTSLAKYGPQEYISRRIQRLLIPALFGIIFLVPLFYLPAFWRVFQGTPRFLDYLNFYVYLVTNTCGQLGPFWFLYVLFLLSASATIILHFKPRAPFKLSPTFRSAIILTLTILTTHYFQTHPAAIPLNILTLPASNFVQYIGYFWLGISLSQLQGFKHAAKLALPGIIITPILFYLATPRPLLTLALITTSLALTHKYFPHLPTWLTYLHRRSFGIYTLHYLFVVYFGYALLYISWPPLSKVTFTFIVSLGCSLILISAYRKLSTKS